VLARQVASFGGGRVVASLLSAAWLVLAARRLPLAQFGDLSVLLSVGAIFAILSDLGWPLLVTDAVARAGGVGRRTLVHVIVRRILPTCAATLVTGAFYLTVASDKRAVIPLLFGVSLLATAVHSSITAVLRGLGRYGVDAVNDSMSRLAVLAAGTLWLVHGGGLVAAVAVYALADVLSAVVIGALAWQWVRPWDDTIDLAAFGPRRTAHLTVGRLLDTLYYRVDLWLVALIGGSADAARYAAPYRILDGLQLLPRAFGMVALAHSGSREARGEAPLAPRRIALVAAAMAGVVALPAALFAHPLLQLTFGKAIAEAAPVFVVLMASSLPGAVVTALLPRAAVLDSRRFARSMAVALAVNVVLNLLLIPPFGPLGAAWTTLVCQTGLALRLLTLAGGRGLAAGAPSEAPAAVAAERQTEVQAEVPTGALPTSR
jgi:O-antigen/teichoic acid export membrane protein